MDCEALTEGLQERSPYSLKESSRILNETVQTLTRKAWVLLMESFNGVCISNDEKWLIKGKLQKPRFL